uniref:hypothetical protein n=1 Tax=Faecousia sp. TaxID=2952921 RepID=UPI004027D34E
MAEYKIDTREEKILLACPDETVRVLQNVKNLLLCRRGEVPYDRMRGLDPGLFELPLGEVQKILLPEIDRVLAWEPRAEAKSAVAELENGALVITVTVEV